MQNWTLFRVIILVRKSLRILCIFFYLTSEIYVILFHLTKFRLCRYSFQVVQTKVFINNSIAFVVLYVFLKAISHVCWNIGINKVIVKCFKTNTSRRIFQSENFPNLPGTPSSTWLRGRWAQPPSSLREVLLLDLYRRLEFNQCAVDLSINLLTVDISTEFLRIK